MKQKKAAKLRLKVHAPGTGKNPVVEKQRREMLKTIGAASATCLIPTVWLPSTATAAGLQDYQIAQHESLTLFVDFDSKPSNVDIFLLGAPERLVVDLQGVTGAVPKASSYSKGAISEIRFGRHADKLRMVVDLREAVAPHYHFIERHDGQRLVVDLGIPGQLGLAEAGRGIERQDSLRDVVVAIDAGHGGKDPGAVGTRRTYEKDVTLQIARRLEARLRKKRGIKVAMIRSNDTYVGLRERTQRARKMHADLFISLHADAFPRRDARGSSVYALSPKGASSEAAKFLAKQENSYDPLIGVDMGDMSSDLKRTLIELSQTSTIESSLELGSDILGHLGNIGAVHKTQVEQANFAVLRSPDTPSVLVETAFISNPAEEKKLRTPRYQQRLALAIEAGVMDYLKVRAPSESWLASQAG